MISKAEERKSDLRNTTVMEVIIAVILILMIFIYSQSRDNKGLKEELFNSKSILNDKIKKLEEKNLKNKKEIYKLTIENKKLKRNLKEKEDEIKQLEQFIGKGGSETTLLKLRIKKLKEDIKRLELIISKLKLDAAFSKNNLSVGILKDKFNDLQIKYQLLIKENKRLKRKVNILDGDGGGSDKPRCKISLGEIDFLANISKKMDGKFSVEIIGDTTLRDTIRKELPGIDFNYGSFSRQEFANFANKLYKWGERQPEKCRFYVKVDRKKINTLDDIDFIGRYFYKSYGRK